MEYQFLSARPETIALALGFAFIGYQASKVLNKKPRTKRRSRSKRISDRKKSRTSRFLRRARATTVPMQFLMTRARGGKKIGLRAADWVAEQQKLLELNKKGPKYGTRRHK